MKILVLGAGVVGVTTAYELLRDGHEVSVIERHPSAANECSLANAGLVAPGHALAWASPKVPAILLRSLYRDDQAFRFRLRADPHFWRWSIRFLGECTAARARVNTLRKHALCRYSQQRLAHVLTENDIEYDRQEGGLLYLYRSQESLDRGVANTKILAEDGQQMEVLDRDGLARVDPGYVPVLERLAGGIYCPTDESGDSNRFTQALAAVCESRGARFHYDTNIASIVGDADRVLRVVTDRGEFEAEHYILALGPYSPLLARKLGIDLPVYPVKGYSATLAIDDAQSAPRLGAVDEDKLVAYVRLGERLRVTATAQFSGYDTDHRPQDFTGMLRAVRELFPRCADYERPVYRACLRPMTPQGTPVFGRGRHRNLTFNTGQGHMGWTMACGSARITADLLAGREPAIDITGMTLER